MTPLSRGGVAGQVAAFIRMDRPYGLPIGQLVTFTPAERPRGPRAIAIQLLTPSPVIEQATGPRAIGEQPC